METVKVATKQKAIRPRCHNCVHASKAFKVTGNTHHHCMHPKHDIEFKSNPNYSAWDTLVEWHHTCADHLLTIKK